MKVLLDESLPRRLKNDFKGYHVKTVPDAGWQGKKNGELLKLMSGRFDVFITADQNLQHQLNLRNSSVAVVVLSARTNTYHELEKLIPKVLKYLKQPSVQGVKIID